jgi:hypothetical protein
MSVETVNNRSKPSSDEGHSKGKLPAVTEESSRPGTGIGNANHASHKDPHGNESAPPGFSLPDRVNSWIGYELPEDLCAAWAGSKDTGVMCTRTIGKPELLLSYLEWALGAFVAQGLQLQVSFDAYICMYAFVCVCVCVYAHNWQA